MYEILLLVNVLGEKELGGFLKLNSDPRQIIRLNRIFDVYITLGFVK